MADSSERSNTPHLVEEEEEYPQQQREITNNQSQIELIPIDDDEIGIVLDPDTDGANLLRDLDDLWNAMTGLSSIDDFIELDDDEIIPIEDEVEDYVNDGFDEQDYVNDGFDEEEEEEEDSSSEEDEPIGGGGGGEVAAVGEGDEIDGLICPICMGPWTSGGDHQLCCLSCGHLYGLSCIKRWLELCKGSAKCPQCNRKCKPKDVRVLYASRVVVADEESKEAIQFREDMFALLEKKIIERCKLEDERYEETKLQSAQMMKRIVEEEFAKRSEEQERQFAQFLQKKQQEFAQFMKRLADRSSHLSLEHHCLHTPPIDCIENETDDPQEK